MNFVPHRFKTFAMLYHHETFELEFANRFKWQTLRWIRLSDSRSQPFPGQPTNNIDTFGARMADGNRTRSAKVVADPATGKFINEGWHKYTRKKGKKNKTQPSAQQTIRAPNSSTSDAIRCDRPAGARKARLASDIRRWFLIMRIAGIH